MNRIKFIKRRFFLSTKKSIFFIICVHLQREKEKKLISILLLCQNGLKRETESEKLQTSPLLYSLDSRQQ